MITIESLDGKKVDFKKQGLKVLKFSIDSLSTRGEAEQIDGRDGQIYFNSSFEGRSMRATFLIDANDYQDFSLIRNDVFKLFNGKTTFYLTELNQPKKRWKVRTTSKFNIERVSRRLGTIDVEFFSDSPFAESIGTTLNPFTFEEDKWQVGQGLITMEEQDPVESSSSKYTFSTENFSIYNAGDVLIDPRSMPLKITFQGVSSNLVIKNITTNEVWSYVGSTNNQDVLVLDGIRNLKNNGSIFKDTNRKILTIAPGWNDFIITGSTGFTIEFDFRFYYI